MILSQYLNNIYPIFKKKLSLKKILISEIFSEGMRKFKARSWTIQVYEGCDPSYLEYI